MRNKLFTHQSITGQSPRLLSGAIVAACMVHLPVAADGLNMYGQGHVSLDSVDNGATSFTKLASSSSRFGIKGEHGMDGDITAFFQYETGVDLTGQGFNEGNGAGEDDEVNGQLFTRARPSFVGIRGNFGSVKIGHTAGLDQWANDQNYFADQVGDVGNFWEANAGVGGRWDNVLQYQSPEVSGASATITMVPDENDTDNSITAIKINYAQDELKLGLAIVSEGTGTGNDDASILALTAGYNFGDFTLGGGYQSVTDKDGSAGDDRDDFFIGGSYNTSEKCKFKLQFASTSNEAPNSDATMVAIGYDHKLNDNTTIYAAYAMVSNDDGAKYGVNGKGHGDALDMTNLEGKDPTALSIGIVSHFDIALGGD